MSLDIVETSTPETTATVPTEPETSLADHEQQFDRPSLRSPVPKDLPKDPEVEPERPRERHRAQSQQASAEDVATIAELTKTLREKETELGKVKPDAQSGSSRVLNLRRQIRGLEAELADAQPKPAPAPAAAPRQEPAAPTETTFTKAKPTIDDMIAAGHADPYAELPEAILEWRDEKRAFEQQQTQGQQAVAKRVQDEIDAHQARTRVFAQQTPDFQTKFDAMMKEIGGSVPDVFGAAIVRADNGPQIVYALASDPVFRDEMLLWSEGKPFTEATVALLQRRLLAHVSRQSAVSTGSATPHVVLPPKPPNPVRTGAMRAEPQWPGDDAPLSEHEKAFHRRRKL